MIICIGREYGSGGHEIGKLLANRLNIPLYDRQLVDMAIARGESISAALEMADEKKANAFFHSVWYEAVDKDLRGLSASDIVFSAQSEAVLELAQMGGGVFVGRCADHILEQAAIPHVSLFISAPFSDRVKRKMAQLQQDEKTVTTLVRKMDKQRKAYYNYYTGGNWGRPDHYDFCVNSSMWGIERTAQILELLSVQEKRQENHSKMGRIENGGVEI